MMCLTGGSLNCIIHHYDTVGHFYNDSLLKWLAFCIPLVVYNILYSTQAQDHACNALNSQITMYFVQYSWSIDENGLIE